jgi:hypothetical protein
MFTLLDILFAARKQGTGGNLLHEKEAQVLKSPMLLIVIMILAASKTEEQVVKPLSVGWFIPVCPTCSVGHPWNASFHFSFLI